MDYIKILEKLKPFFALMLVIFMMVCTVQLIKYNKLQGEIKDNCGYKNKEKVFCVCDKTLISQIPLINNPYYEGQEELVIGDK